MHPDVVRIALPAAAPPPPRASFPFVQALAPLVLAVVLWLVTGSPFALVVALLGPVLVIASTVEGRRSARRARRDDRERLVRRLEAVGEDVKEALARRCGGFRSKGFPRPAKAGWPEGKEWQTPCRPKARPAPG